MNYQQPYTTIDAPSYADPNLLAAVMDQADKANYRYPSEAKKTIVPKKDQTESASAKVETFGSKPNDFNPFELFPPAFHELLEIPIHTYANGTTYNPHDKHKMRRPSNPTITGGYASTNVNGQKSDKEQEAEKERDFNPKRITPKRRRRPTVQETQTKRQRTAEPEIETSRPTVRKPIIPQRRRIVYTDLQKTSDGKRRLNRIPPPGKDLKKRRPVRPSLRFRTRAPVQRITYPTETTTPLPEPTTTTTVMPTTTELSTSTARARRPINPLRTRTNSPDRRPVKPFFPEDANPLLPQEIKVREVFRTDEDPSYFETEEPSTTTTEANYYNDRIYEESHTFRQPAFDAPSRKINKIKNDIAFETEPLLNKEVNTNLYHYSNTEPDFPNDIYKIPAKQNPPKKVQEFRPSKRDPFVGKLPSYPPFMKNLEENIPHLTIQSTTYAPIHVTEKKEFLQPTTFRPTYFDKFYEVLPPVRNTYQQPTYEGENYYSGNEFREAVVPFANSQSVRRPFPPPNAYTGPVERQRLPQAPRKVPVYSPNPFFGGAHAIQEQFNRFDLHSPLKIEIPSPASPPRGGFSYDGRFSYDNTPPRRRISRPNGGNGRPGGKRRGSFLSKFFKTRQVNRRSGISSPKAQVNDIKSKDGKHSKGDVDYVITYGPPPINGKKLVVIGPFKEPPIGAPRIFPGNPASTYDQPPTEPSLNLKPPSTFQTATSSETSTREPSFKIFNLPKESNEIIHHDDKSSNSDQTAKMGLSLQQNEIEPRELNNIAFNKVGNNIGLPYYKQNIRKVSPRFNASQSVNRPLTVNHDNYHLFKEVSEEDKERIIAAKFEFPRESSVRRSGLERHIIPIPVPMISSSGDQISKFHNLQVPHVPVLRKMGRTPTEKRPRRIENVYVPIQKSLPKINKDQRTGNANLPAPSGDYSSTPMRITPYPKFATIRPNNEPQSYREPSVSDIKFGGWQAVGEPPIVSYVQEVTPLSFKLKGEMDQKTMDVEDIPEDQVEEEAEVPSKNLAEDHLVRFSSKLNVEAPEVVRSYLVNPPRKL